MVRFVGERVGEVVLRRIAGEIGERQHDDGKTRGLGGGVFVATVAGRFALRNHHAPPAITTSSAAIAAASGASAERFFGAGGFARPGSGGFAWAGTPTCSE